MLHDSNVPLASSRLPGPLQDVLPPRAYNAAKTLVLTVGVAVMSGILLLVIFYVISSPTFGWTGDAAPPQAL